MKKILNPAYLTFLNEQDTSNINTHKPIGSYKLKGGFPYNVTNPKVPQMCYFVI